MRRIAEPIVLSLGTKRSNGPARPGTTGLPERLDALRRYAARRRTPVAWLIKDYVDYLLDGGQPVAIADADAPSSDELSFLMQHGGEFDWLADEPDVYSATDGEPL